MLDLVSQVRNVVLMNVYLDLENPGGSGFWSGGVYEPGEGNGEVFLIIYSRKVQIYIADTRFQGRNQEKHMVIWL